MNEFSRLELYAKVNRPPEVKYKDLELIVTSRMVRDQVKFSYRTDFLKVTTRPCWYPLPCRSPISNSFKSKDGVHSASLNIFGRVSTLTGRVVQTFEDSVTRDFPNSLYAAGGEAFFDLSKSTSAAPGIVPARHRDQGCRKRKRGSREYTAGGAAL